MSKKKRSSKSESASDAAGWAYKSADNDVELPEATDEMPGQSEAQAGSLERTASEFVGHRTGSRWYVALATGTLAVSALLYLITDDVISLVVVLVLAIILGIS